MQHLLKEIVALQLRVTSLNSTLESTQQSLVSLDSCHDYSYKNTAKERD